MANQEHLDILKQGVEIWNEWREEHLEIRPDLTGANLTVVNLIEPLEDPPFAGLSRVNFSEANLFEANLRRANFYEANLSRANLSRANLSGTFLYEVNLSEANLENANLRFADLRNAILRGANLSSANLEEADFSYANLENANLSGTDLSRAKLRSTHLQGGNLSGAKISSVALQDIFLSRACLSGLDLTGIDFSGKDLSGSNLSGANLYGANLYGANLSEADLHAADLTGAILNTADLSGADLSRVTLVETNLTRATLTACSIYGISAWNIELEGAIQESLVITRQNEPTITVDNLEVAQFIYLLLNNKKIRNVIDTITSKVVLIIGRFTPERKAVLDAIRNEIRRYDYLPVVFDFEKPANRDITETISTLAHMARFVIADITDAKSIPQELMLIVPNLPSVPVQPLILASQHEYSMFEHFTRYSWVLSVYQYTDQASLLQSLKEKVIEPAEQKANELEKR